MIVVISQSSANLPKLREFEEQLVTHLLLEVGCEVNLVPDLEHLGAESTGLLCLEGIRGSMLLASWHAATNAHSFLADHGIHGKLVSRDSDVPTPAFDVHKKLAPGIYNAMQRTIYHLQLDLDNSVDYYNKRVHEIEKESQVQTFSLAASSETSASDTPVAEPSSSHVSTPSVADTNPTPSQSAVAPVPKRSHQQIEVSENDESLDALIDQLDESGL